MTRIDTVDQLDALPIGSVILDLDQDAWQKQDNGAWSLADIGDYDEVLRFTAEYLPATVLFVPGRDLVQEAKADAFNVGWTFAQRVARAMGKGIGDPPASPYRNEAP